MAKGNGNTRNGSSGNPRALASAGNSAREIEDSIKADFVSGREEAIAEIKSYRAKGKAGEIANPEIDKAIPQTESALRMYESINSIEDINTIEERVGTELKRIANRLDDMADTHQANANDATGRVKNTYEKAASALYMAAHNIRSADRYAPTQTLARLWDALRSQNKWK